MHSLPLNLQHPQEPLYNWCLRGIGSQMPILLSITVDPLVSNGKPNDKPSQSYEKLAGFHPSSLQIWPQKQWWGSFEKKKMLGLKYGMY